MRNAFFFGLLSALLGLASACHKFDNPVEAANLGRSSGLVKVTIDGIDPQATVLGVDLHWNENGAAREVVFHKLVSLSGADKKLVVSFDGLGAGLGYAQAGSYVGQTPWQAPVRGDTLMVSGTGVGLSRLLLGFVDGDVDLDFDLDYDMQGDEDVQSDGDTDEAIDGDQSEGELEEEVGPWEPSVLLNVPYSANTPLLDGNVDADTEWKDAGFAMITTGVSDPTLLFVKHNAQALYVAMILPGQPTPGGETEKDRAVFGFDVGEPAGQDAYTIEVEPSGTSACTLLFDGSRGCSSLNPRPDYIAKTSKLTEGTGFMVEMTLPFSALGLKTGLAKTIRFAAFFYDNSDTGYYSWPASTIAKPTTVYGWAGLQSTSNWGFAEPSAVAR